MATQVHQLTSINPATEGAGERFDPMSVATVEAILEKAGTAFSSWSATGFEHRAAVLRRAAELLRERSTVYAATVTREMGKPVGEAQAEIEKCAIGCEHYAQRAAEYLRDEPAPSDGATSFVAFEPLGTVLAVMPWNFPHWQVFRFAAPALMAGNTAVLKHASNVTRCALDIEAVFTDAGAPEGVFTTLVIPSDAVAAVIEHPVVRAVTLTGSDFTGAKVAAKAGEQLKKTVLELGGSDAFVVLEDADLDQAAAIAVKSRFQNCGQSCIAAKRFIVVASVAREFTERVKAKIASLTIGDPTDPGTTLGPLARDDLRSGLEDQLRRSVGQGARVVTGGRRWGDRGWFFEPTLVDRCTETTTAFAEETFGPLAAVMEVRDAEHALAVANASPYGLGGNLWTADIDRGIALARRMETGGVFINGMTHSDPRLPFGGVKRSGYGRELHSYGIREFVNVQTIWVGGGQKGARGSTVE